VAIDIACPACGESENLTGKRSDEKVVITCGACGQSWERPTSPTCSTCGSNELQQVPLAIVERSRGTQLSVVGIRNVNLCPVCDADAIARWQENRPNPLMPDELPSVGKVDR
jgi:Zn ribbon nucleic-acid-binding protein